MTSPSRYLEDLPAVFSGEEAGGALLGHLLLAFEEVLTGRGYRHKGMRGLEEELDGIVDAPGRSALSGVHRYFSPQPLAGADDEAEFHQTPPEFLAWLGGWVALSLRADLDEARQRELIAKAVRLYRLRGTARGLEEVVRIYTGLGPRIDEMSAAMQVGDRSRVGVDTVLGGGAPHFFRVHVYLPSTDVRENARQLEVIRAVIEAEKPAHTHYSLRWSTPRLQIGVHSTIGRDTLLGSAEH